MENNYFVTITGTKYYYGMKPFELGRIFKLVKEPHNEYDSEAIRAAVPKLPLDLIKKINMFCDSATISHNRYSQKKVKFIRQ